MAAYISSTPLWGVTFQPYTISHLMAMDSGVAQHTDDSNSISSKGAVVIIVTVTFSALSFLFVGLRLWARRVRRSTLTVNDFMIMAALVFQVGEMAVLILGTRLGGIGYHASMLSSNKLNHLMKIYMAVEPLWISSNFCARISMIHLYITTFPSRRFLVIAYTVAALVAVCWVSTIIRMCLLCTPLAYIRDKSIQGGHCIDMRASWISVSIIDLVLNVVILIIPIPMLRYLQLPGRRKMALGSVFMFGSAVCAISALRVISIARLNSADMSYSIVYHAIWSALEPCLSIITACLPVLQPILSKPVRRQSCYGLATEPGTLFRTYLRSHHRIASIEVKNTAFRPLTANTTIFPPPTNFCSVQPKQDIDSEANSIIRQQMENLQGILVTQDWDVRTLKEAESPGTR
ncbi:hypothetical protein DTO271G3_6743 [Paecilomyces variotii]|nr:hypothetical protein DTO271G3_6743 [Paecilomyces variotii]